LPGIDAISLFIPVPYLTNKGMIKSLRVKVVSLTKSLMAGVFLNLLNRVVGKAICFLFSLFYRMLKNSEKKSSQKQVVNSFFFTLMFSPIAGQRKEKEKA
jgi:hypothetical protein